MMRLVALMFFLITLSSCETLTPAEFCAQQTRDYGGDFDRCLDRRQQDDRALLDSLSDMSRSAGTLTVYPGSVDQLECGNNDCTLRVDSLSRYYCTCKGRQGRAKISCCE